MLTVRGEVYRSVPPRMGTPHQLALQLLHAVLELVDDPVHGGEGVRSRGVGSHDVSVAVQVTVFVPDPRTRP